MTAIAVSRPAPSRIPFVVNVLAGMGIVIAVLLAVYWLPEHAFRADAISADLDHVYYYRAAVRLAHGEPLYVGQFLYPPPFAALVAFAAHLSFMTFQGIWYSLVLLAFWAYAWGLARIAVGRPTVRHVLAAATVLIFTPGTSVTMSFGNFDVCTWALCAWALSGHERQKVKWEVLATFGACLKAYPATISMVAVWREPRTYWRHAHAIAAMWIFALATLGPRPILEWFHVGMVPLPDLIFFWRNMSLSTAVLRVFHVVDVHSAFARIVFVAIPAAVVGGTVWATRRWSLRSAGAVVLVATVWSAPVCWWYWLPLGLVPAAAWVRTKVEVRA